MAVCFDPIKLDSRLKTRSKQFMTLIYAVGDPWVRVRVCVKDHMRVIRVLYIRVIIRPESLYNHIRLILLLWEGYYGCGYDYSYDSGIGCAFICTHILPDAVMNPKISGSVVSPLLPKFLQEGRIGQRIGGIA